MEEMRLFRMSLSAAQEKTLKLILKEAAVMATFPFDGSWLGITPLTSAQYRPVQLSRVNSTLAEQFGELLLLMLLSTAFSSSAAVAAGSPTL